MGGMVVIGELWRHDDEEGKIYLTGKMGAAKLLVFPNRHKKYEMDPDYHVYVASEKRQEQGDTASAPLPGVAIN